MRQKWVTFTRNLIAAAMSTAVTLVVAELICEYFESDEILSHFIDTPHPFMDYDPMLGWKIRPDTHGIFLINNTASQVYNNHEGMRYHEIGPKTGFRVAVLGDSITWGYSVDNDQRFTDRIEKALHIDMLNYAVMGYGPLQYYLQLDQVIAQKPDVVVVAFTLYNDFEDNVRNTAGEFYHPYAELSDGQLVVRGQPVPDYRKYTILKRPELTNRYALARLFYETLRRVSPPLFDAMYGVDRKNLPPFKNYFNFRTDMLNAPQLLLPAFKVLEINKAILKAMRDKLAAQNIRMMILACPTEPDGNANTRLLLQGQAKELDIPFVDVPGFEKGDKYTFPDHVHWRPSGHQLAAEALITALRPYMKK